MLIRVDDRQAALLNGALAAVATAGGTRGITDVDRRALDAFDRYILRRSAPSESPSPPDTTPFALAAAFGDTADRTHVVQFLIVMAVVDGTVDPARIATALRYANALGVDDDAVHRLAELARGNPAWVRADAQRQNMLSITGREVDMVEDA